MFSKLNIGYIVQRIEYYNTDEYFKIDRNSDWNFMGFLMHQFGYTFWDILGLEN